MTPRAVSRYGDSLLQLSVFGSTSAAIAPTADASTSLMKRPPTTPPAQYLRDASIGTNKITTQAMTASQAALDRERTRAAERSAAPMEPSRAPFARRAGTVHQTREGRPMTAMCATKFRLPNVPPGARLVLKYSVSRPYACASDSSAARTAAVAAATNTGRYCPPRSPSDRAPQNTIPLVP